MGVKQKELSPIHIYYLKDLYDEIELSINNKTDLDINNTVKQLSSLIFLGKLIKIIASEFFLETPFCPFCLVISIYDIKEKFLSLKIIFLLIEELKNNENLLKEKIISVFNSNDNISLDDFQQSEKCKNILYKITKYIRENSSHIQNLSYLFLFIFFKYLRT